MKNRILFVVCIVVCVICVSCTKELYSYKDYDEAAYSYAKTTGDRDLKKIQKSYEKIVTSKGSKKKSEFDETRIPPGTCVDYAYLMLQQQDTNSAYIWLEKEVSLYPESKTFVETFKKNLGL